MLPDHAVRTAELFSGIGGFRIASDSLGLQTVFANDIDPIACLVYGSAFEGEALAEGDLNEVLDQVPEHHILTGGFPCQPFSFAGKKGGMKDGRASTLQMIRKVLVDRRPPVFVLENVRSLLTIANGAHFRRVLSILTDLGYVVEWRVINLMNLGLPQNRQRVILLGYQNPLVPPTLEQCVLLRRDPAPHTHGQIQRGRIRSRSFSFPRVGIAWADRFEAIDERPKTELPFPMSHLLESKTSQRYDFTAATQKRLPFSKQIDAVIDGVEVLWNQEGGRRMGYTVFGVRGAAPTLTSTTSRHYERYKVGSRYRRLTPVEYARLQGFPDHHCDLAPHSKRYVLLGNAIPPPVARWGLEAALAVYEASVSSFARVG